MTTALGRAAHVASAQWNGVGDSVPHVIHLQDGQAAQFGFCVCGHCNLEIRMDLAGVFGQLHAESHVCWLSNLSRHATLVIWDLEDPHQRLRVGSGQAVPVPFELARVGLLGGGDAGFLTIFGPEPHHGGDRAVGLCAAAQPPALNSGTAYYAVLRLLCDAWVDPHRKRLPTSEEIASTLRQRGMAITSKAVDHHIDYLIRRIRPDRQPGRWSREALVEMCVAQRWLQA